MLRLILATSADGYVARGRDDDMRWTGDDDKRVFRLLTSVGGTCGIGSTSYRLMPPLPGRRLVCISGRPGFARPPLPPVSASPSEMMRACEEKVSVEPLMTLGEFARAHPEGWLLGGPTVAMAALEKDLVGQVYLCRADVQLGEPGSPFNRNLIPDEVSRFVATRGERQNAGIPFSRTQRIRFGTTTVECYTRVDRRPQP